MALHFLPADLFPRLKWEPADPVIHFEFYNRQMQIHNVTSFFQVSSANVLHRRIRSIYICAWETSEVDLQSGNTVLAPKDGQA